MTATPRWATPLTPGRRNQRSAAEKLTKLLGLELLPWQSDAIALWTEMDDDGHYCYPDCTLLVSRQSGKSTLLLVYLLVRALGTPDTYCVLGEQTLKDSRAMLLETWEPMLAKSALAGVYTVRQANGSERLKFANGSQITLLTTTSEKAGHGQVVDCYVQDEAFALADSRTEVAMRPAMATRSHHGGGPQMLVVSTAGTPIGSPYLLQKVEDGRKRVDAGVTTGNAYIEYSAPDGCDPSDPNVWRECNPSLGYTITEDAIRAEFEALDGTDFLRSRLNVWTTQKVDPVIPLDLWHDLTDEFSSPTAPLFMAFDSSPDGAHSAIAVASRRADGRIHVEVAKAGPGTGWLASEIRRMNSAHQPFEIVVDCKSPARVALPELTEHGMPVRELMATEASAAFATFVTTAADKVLVHREDPRLTVALTGAVRRQLGDAYAWSRRNSAVDISPLVAATEAVYACATHTGQIGIWSLADIVKQKRERQRAEQGITSKQAERIAATRVPTEERLIEFTLVDDQLVRPMVAPGTRWQTRNDGLDPQSAPSVGMWAPPMPEEVGVS